jgi:phosphoribosylanthranilate isomerase
MMPLIKICGLSDVAAVDAAVDAGADAVGFVFADSVRRVSVQHAVEITMQVPRRIKKVAVMLHPSDVAWQEVRNVFKPDVLQTDLADFDYLVVPDGIGKWPVIREGAVPSGDELPEIFVYEGKASGSGESVDWQLAAQLARRGRMILAGGLSSANVLQAIREIAPFGVDVSSGVEAAPGKKDTNRIREFIDAVRAAGSFEEDASV